MKILLIDDEPYVLKMLAHQLARLGFADTIPHEDAQGALALLEHDATAIDMVFCDLQMAQMDGIEFVRHLARIDYAGGLVLVSGEDQRILRTAEKLAQAHRLNILGALQKPVQPEQLRQIVNAYPAGDTRSLRPERRAEQKSYGPDELQRAIASGEMINYYQPKVSADSGAVVGVEALVRWQHPQDGLISPAGFVAAVEEYGLIDNLTQAVLTRALHQARQWMDAGLHLNVAVNISMDDLVRLDFPDFVVRTAEQAGVEPARLTLEVTESRLMKDLLAPLDILTRLRLKRIGLSIDDFGTGYSSLAQLRNIPFDELKIDQGFVHGAHRDDSLRAIVMASARMAWQLGMKTVAEGVENRDDWDFVCEAGCDVIQGYFISRPLPAETLPGWIDAWETYRPALPLRQPGLGARSASFMS